MTEKTLYIIGAATAIISALIPLLEKLKKLLITIKEIYDIFRNRDNLSKETRERMHAQLRELLLWLCVIISTLLLPEFFITYSSVATVSGYLSQQNNDLETFVVQIILITAAIATCYTLFWSFYLYPFIQKKLSGKTH
ncbi:MAG: hypothetical protein HGA46_11460 [Chlorobiaceae bacterium]|nr:hypothetical protein [Chlorobiaceae bacterium]